MKNQEQQYTNRDKVYAIFASVYIPIAYAYACIKAVKGVIKLCEDILENVDVSFLPIWLRIFYYIGLLISPAVSLVVCMCSGYISKISPLQNAVYADDYKACLQKYKSWVMMDVCYKAFKDKAKKIWNKVCTFMEKRIDSAKRGVQSALAFSCKIASGFISKVSDVQHLLSRKGMCVLHLTENQYQLLLRVVQTMMQMYAGNLHSVLQDIGRQNKTEDMVNEALGKFMYMYTTLPTNNQWIPVHRLMEVFYNRSIYDHKNLSVYRWTLKLTMREQSVLKEILQTYMDISMGRFYVILEQMPPQCQVGSSLWNKYHSACMNGTEELLEARDMLIPSLHGTQWHAGNGLLGPNTSNEAKIAYQMLQVLSGQVPLPVVEEPLPYIS